MKKQSGVLVFALCCSALGTTLPSGFQSCRCSEWTEVNDCLKSAIQDALPKLRDGIPDLGVIPLDPIVVPNVTVEEGTNAVDVIQNFTDFKHFGLSNAIINDFQFKLADDKKNAELTINTFISDFWDESLYSFDGKILGFEIVGEGNCKVAAKNIKIDVVIDTEIYEKDGKQYLNVTKVRTKYTPEKITYKLDNLFNGNEVLGKQVNAALNANWKIIFDDIKGGYESLLSTILFNYTNSIFSKVPCEEFLPSLT